MTSSTLCAYEPRTIASGSGSSFSGSSTSSTSQLTGQPANRSSAPADTASLVSSGSSAAGRASGPTTVSWRRGPVCATARSHSASVGACSSGQVTSASERVRSVRLGQNTARASSTKNDGASGLPSSSQ